MHSENQHYWLKSGTITLLLNVQSLIFGFGSFYLLIRLLDKSSFGAWALFIATTTFFEMARNGLVQNGLIKFLSQENTNNHQAIQQASFTLSTILMALCIGINTLLAPFLADIWHYPQLLNLFIWYNIVFVLQGILSQFQWIEQAYFKFIGNLFSSILKQGIFFLYLLACYFELLTISLQMLLYVQIIAAAIALITQYFFVRKNIYLQFTGNIYWIKALFNYGKFSFGTSLGSIISNTVNQLLLGAQLSTQAAGAFNVMAKISNLIDVPSNAVGAIVFPQSAKRFTDEGKDAIKYLYEKSVGTILGILFPSVLFLLLFPTFVVHTIAGNNYDEIIPYLRILILICLVTPYGRLFGTILDSIGKPKVNFIVIVLYSIMAITSNYLLINSYGLAGAVYATIITDLIIFSVMQAILYKLLRVNFLNTFIYAYQFYPDIFYIYIIPKVKLMMAKRR